MTGLRYCAVITALGAVLFVLSVGTAAAQEVSGRGTGPGVTVEAIAQETAAAAAQAEATSSESLIADTSETEEVVLGASVSAPPSLTLPRTGGFPPGMPLAGAAAGLALVVAGLRFRMGRGLTGRS